MPWERMSLDEYADLERSNGVRVYKINGFYWKMVRPFFYRPLLPFVKIMPGKTHLPPNCFWGGFQYPVPSYDLANSYMNLFVVDEISGYSVGKLSYDQRYKVRKGLKSLAVKPVSGFNEFVTEGHSIYVSFYRRTNYEWRNDRVDRERFSQWAQTIFSFPKLLVLGAYGGNRLCAVNISCLVEDIVLVATSFSNAEALKLRVSDLMLHTIREMASECGDIKCIYGGFLTKKDSLNTAKIARGYKIVARPAYFWLNPAWHLLVKRFKPEEYKRLIGMDQKELAKYKFPL